MQEVLWVFGTHEEGWRASPNSFRNQFVLNIVIQVGNNLWGLSTLWKGLSYHKSPELYIWAITLIILIEKAGVLS